MTLGCPLSILVPFSSFPFSLSTSSSSQLLDFQLYQLYQAKRKEEMENQMKQKVGGQLQYHLVADLTVQELQYSERERQRRARQESQLSTLEVTMWPYGVHQHLPKRRRDQDFLQGESLVGRLHFLNLKTNEGICDVILIKINFRRFDTTFFFNFKELRKIKEDSNRLRFLVSLK